MGCRSRKTDEVCEERNLRHYVPVCLGSSCQLTCQYCSEQLTGKSAWKDERFNSSHALLIFCGKQKLSAASMHALRESSIYSSFWAVKIV